MCMLFFCKFVFCYRDTAENPEGYEEKDIFPLLQKGRMYVFIYGHVFCRVQRLETTNEDQANQCYSLEA